MSLTLVRSLGMQIKTNHLKSFSNDKFIWMPLCVYWYDTEELALCTGKVSVLSLALSLRHLSCFLSSHVHFVTWLSEDQVIYYLKLFSLGHINGQISQAAAYEGKEWERAGVTATMECQGASAPHSATTGSWVTHPMTLRLRPLDTGSYIRKAQLISFYISNQNVQSCLALRQQLLWVSSERLPNILKVTV